MGEDAVQLLVDAFQLAQRLLVITACFVVIKVCFIVINEVLRCLPARSAPPAQARPHSGRNQAAIKPQSDHKSDRRSQRNQAAIKPQSDRNQIAIA